MVRFLIVFQHLHSRFSEKVLEGEFLSSGIITNNYSDAICDYKLEMMPQPKSRPGNFRSPTVSLYTSYLKRNLEKTYFIL